MDRVRSWAVSVGSGEGHGSYRASACLWLEGEPTAHRTDHYDDLSFSELLDVLVTLADAWRPATSVDTLPPGHLQATLLAELEAARALARAFRGRPA